MSSASAFFPIHGASRPLVGGEALDITESYAARQEIVKLEAQLAKQKLKQQKNSAEAIIHAQQEERARLGHEMHDNVNQILASAQLYIGQLDPTHAEFADIKARSIEIVGLAIEELRQLARDMVMPDFKEEGLLGSIRKLVDELKVCKRFDIRFVYNNKKGIESLDPNLKITLFRIVQEQVKNIIKYSKANNLVIDLHCDDLEVRLEIADDGRGFDPDKTRRGLGLSNIYERTSLYNGNVMLHSAPGQGCTLIISIPTS